MDKGVDLNDGDQPRQSTESVGGYCMGCAKSSMASLSANSDVTDAARGESSASSGSTSIFDETPTGAEVSIDDLGRITLDITIASFDNLTDITVQGTPLVLRVLGILEENDDRGGCMILRLSVRERGTERIDSEVPPHSDLGEDSSEKTLSLSFSGQEGDDRYSFGNWRDFKLEYLGGWRHNAVLRITPPVGGVKTKSAAKQ